MKSMAAKKIKYCQSAWVTAMSSLLVSYFVLFYMHTKDTHKALLDQSGLLTYCKHWQIFQLNCVLCFSMNF